MSECVCCKCEECRKNCICDEVIKWEKQSEDILD